MSKNNIHPLNEANEALKYNKCTREHALKVLKKNYEKYKSDNILNKTKGFQKLYLYISKLEQKPSSSFKDDKSIVSKLMEISISMQSAKINPNKNILLNKLPPEEREYVRTLDIEKIKNFINQYYADINGECKDYGSEAHG